MGNANVVIVDISSIIPYISSYICSRWDKHCMNKNMEGDTFKHKLLCRLYPSEQFSNLGSDIFKCYCGEDSNQNVQQVNIWNMDTCTRRAVYWASYGRLLSCLAGKSRRKKWSGGSVVSKSLQPLDYKSLALWLLSPVPFIPHLATSKSSFSCVVLFTPGSK